MKDSALKFFLVNLRAAFSINIRKRINDHSNRIANLEEVVSGLDNRMAEKYYYLRILDYFACHEDEAKHYSKELEFLRKTGHYCVFPYPTGAERPRYESGFDEALGFPYVIHRGKKLYFSSKYTESEVVEMYSYYVREEKLLGIEDNNEAPHQYQSPRLCVEEGDLVFDIGAAEGLFALDQVEKVSRVIVVESDPLWIAPLRHTFAPYGDKVTIIEKFMSAVDTENTISLRKLLKDTDYRSAFVKMDIEGCELPAISSAIDFLKEKEGTKMAVACYHRQHDADEIKALFDQIGYSSEYSKGYMLFNSYDTPGSPYFRHGVIRAKKH